MSKVVVIFVFLVSCGSLNQGQPTDARISPDVEIQDAPLDVEILDSPIDSMISDVPTDAPIDSSVKIDSGFDTSATCTSHVSFHGRNASISTNIFCQVPQTISITTEIFDGNTSLNSITQGELGCGSFSGYMLNSISGFPSRATIVMYIDNLDIFKSCSQIMD